MPSTKRRTRRNKRTMRRGGRSRMMGGAGGYDWVASNFGGNTDQQFQNTFGPNPMYPRGALIPTVVGAPAVVAGTFPQGSQMGGRRRRRRSVRRHRR
jgi:hypothetical protein